MPLTDIALRFFESIISRPLIATPPPANLLGRGEISIQMANRQGTKHLLHLIYISYSPSSLNVLERRTRKMTPIPIKGEAKFREWERKPKRERS
ncbi:hypothetical protein LINPERHAP2_LOCUS9032 [Linum perenne]